MYKRQIKLIPHISPNKKYFKEVDVELLKSLFLFQTPSRDAIRQASFMAYLLNWLRQNNIKFKFKYDNVGNLYITKGTSKIYPAIVSHVDTVHSYNRDMTVCNTKNLILGVDNLTGEQCGIGADPKNGVYFALQMLKKLDTCKVVFFVDEECGCVGSGQADLTFFSDCSLICQLDRRSFTTDIIEHTNGIQVLSQEFKDAVDPILQDYGYDFNYGTSTDVGALVKNGVGICAFNFSNGSFNEHCDYEVCSIPHLLNAVNGAYAIILNLGYKQRWLHTPPKNNDFGIWDDWDKRGSRSSYYDRYDDLWDGEVVEQNETFATKTVSGFVKECIFKAVPPEYISVAANRYVYDESDPFNLVWMYDYYTGINCDEVAVCKAIIKYLKASFNYLAQVKLLIKGIEEHQRVAENVQNKRLPAQVL